MRPAPGVVVLLSLLMGSSCESSPSATVPVSSGSSAVDLTVGKKGGQLCLRAGKFGGSCADAPDQAYPVVFGTSFGSSSTDSRAYVVGATLADVEGFSLAVDSESFLVSPTRIPGSAFAGMKVWFLAVETAAGIDFCPRCP